MPTHIPAVPDLPFVANFPELVCPFPHPMLARETSTFGAADVARGCRVVIPRTGTLSGIAINVGTQAGNIDVGVYDTQPTRTALWRRGSLACPAAGWQEVGQPNLTVRRGEQYDFVLATNSSTATFGNFAGVGLMSVLPAGWIPAPLGGSPKLAWSIAASFPLPSTFAEASLTTLANIPIIIGRIV